MLSFGIRCTKMRLAAGLCPNPIGELTASPRFPSRIWGMGQGEDTQAMDIGERGNVKSRRGGKSCGEKRGRGRDRERGRYDVLDNSPMLAGLAFANYFFYTARPYSVLS